MEEKGVIICVYSYLVSQVEVYPSCVIVEGFGTGRKYTVTLEFIPEAINFATVLVVIVVLAFVAVLVLRICAAAVPPPPDCSSSASMGYV